MANDVNKVLAGKPLATGGVLRGDDTAVAPTDAVSAPTGFTALGYIGEEGLTETTDRSTSKIRAWGGDIVKVVQSEFSVTYSFTFYESINADVLKAVYGDDNVASTAADTTHGNQHAIQVKSDQLPRGPWLFEVKDGDARIRIHVPVGQITTVGEVTYSDESVIGYPVTVEAFADSNGVQAYKYIDDGKLAA